MNELKHTLRQLAKSPGFTAIAILTLALGIGANTAIFSVMDKLLLRPLPVTDPETLALLGQPRRDGRVDFEFNYPLFRDYQRENRVFSQIAAVAGWTVGLGMGGTTERMQAQLVSGNYFSLLGVQSSLGRTFAPNEGVEIDDAPVVVLSHGTWVRYFGADPKVIGRKVTVNGAPFTVIGVAPREFTGVIRWQTPELYIPITQFAQINSDRPGGEHPLATRYFTWHQILGRLKPGVTLLQAGMSIQQLARQIYTTPPPNTPTEVIVVPGSQGFGADLRPARLPLNLLLATAGLVLLIACANLANLQMARAEDRRREFAIRLALGSGRLSLVRSLLGESLILSLAGGILGLLVAKWLVQLLSTFRPPNISVSLDASLDPRILAFGLLVASLTGLLFGILPALRSSRPDLVTDLKNGGGVIESRGQRWTLRGALVVTQVALSVLVLVGAGLCLRSLFKLQQLGREFEPSKVALMSLDLGLNNYSDPQARSFFSQLLSQARNLPGVEAAGLASNTPLSGRSPAMSVERVEGFEAGPREHPFGDVHVVSEDYFRVLNTPLVRGRDFGVQDVAGSPAVVIVNEAFVRRYFNGSDPVGKLVFQHGPGGGIPTQVIGVVKNTPTRSLQEPARPAFYFPRSQKGELEMTLAVRTGVDPSQTFAGLRKLVKALDPNLPVFRMQTLEQQKGASLSMQRMAAWLLTGFGGLALLLAALGIYGILSYSISRRSRELGVRMALGAQRSDVIHLVLGQGRQLMAVGLAIGLLGSFAATRLLAGFLFEIQPIDPVTYLSVFAGLWTVAALACWIPARRAATVDPLTALRTE